MEDLYESKFQRFRALAIYKNGTECLLCLGHTVKVVQDSYDTPFFEQLTETEQANISEIHLQKWTGISCKGNWTKQMDLEIPSQISLKITCKPREIVDFSDEFEKSLQLAD